MLSLKKFCFLTFGLDFQRVILYIVMDACDAEYNAFSYNNIETGERYFPDSTFLWMFGVSGVNVFYINSKSKVNIYRLTVEDHQTYPGFKFVFCNCIGIVKSCY